VEVAVSSALNFIPPAPSFKVAVILTLLSAVCTAVVLSLRYCGLGFVAWVNGKSRVAEIKAAGEADIARIRAARDLLHDLAELEPDQAERLRRHLEWVRPPPDQLQPPTAS
jgi:hypothetical protein